MQIKIVYQTEKTLTDLGDKVSAEDKAQIEEKVKVVKDVKDGEDLEAIKKATEDLTQTFYGISSKIYQQANPEGAPGAGFDPNNMGGANAGNASAGNDKKDDNVVDADFKVEDDK